MAISDQAVTLTTLALAGDTMLGRKVAQRLAHDPPRALFSPGLLEIVSAADGMLLNLECCISERGQPWPGRVFHFRAPPAAVDVLNLLGVRCVTVANNHALDFGTDALADTLTYLGAAGIAVAGAGSDEIAARRPVSFEVASGAAVTVIGCTDHPAAYAAGSDWPGVSYANLDAGVPPWLASLVQAHAGGTGPLIVTPHWGPNMTIEPLPYIREAARELIAAGAGAVAGHSAHVFHGVAPPVLYDLGDFVDDYATHSLVRNDLGLLWLVTFAGPRLREVEAIPLHLGFCHTSLATGADEQWIRQRLRAACAAFGTTVEDTDRGTRIRVSSRAAGS